MSRSVSTVLVALALGCSQGASEGPPSIAVDAGALGHGDEAGRDEAGQSDAEGDAGESDVGSSALPDAAPDDAGDAAPPRSGLVVGYYADWTAASLPVTTIDWASLTHVAHAFALPRTGGGLTNGKTFPNDALVQAAHAHGVKVVVAVGGASINFAKAAGDATSRAATVAALATICSQHGYDGVDVDWEFPDSTSIAAWVSLLDELRAALDAIGPGLSLSSTISQGTSNGDILPAASLAKLTWVGAMTYHYTGPNDSLVGFFAPLRSPAGDGSVEASIQHIVSRGVPASKLLVGLGFYGEQFKDGPPGTPISSPSAVTTMDQRSIVPLIGQAGWTLSWDPTASESSLLNGSTWITYEDAPSIDAKCAFAHATGLGGAMVWHMATGLLADGSQPLLARAAGCR